MHSCTIFDWLAHNSAHSPWSLRPTPYAARHYERSMSGDTMSGTYKGLGPQTRDSRPFLGEQSSVCGPILSYFLFYFPKTWTTNWCRKAVDSHPVQVKEKEKKKVDFVGIHTTSGQRPELHSLVVFPQNYKFLMKGVTHKVMAHKMSKTYICGLKLWVSWA